MFNEIVLKKWNEGYTLMQIGYIYQDLGKFDMGWKKFREGLDLQEQAKLEMDQ